MKYSLYKELLKQENILSHVFLNCAQDFIDEIAKKNEGKSKEWVEKRKIDIELKIDGHVCNPKDFFDVLYEQYTDAVKKKATEIVKEQTTETFRELSYKLQNLEEIVDSWAEDINWDVENPFNKKENEGTV